MLKSLDKLPWKIVMFLVSLLRRLGSVRRVLRLSGREIARKEWYKEGRIPLHTIKADIDYATATANTTFGCIGVKVWIYTGDIVKGREEEI